MYLISIQLLLLVIIAVPANSCSIRVAAGASSNPEYVVGNVAELKCDVSSYDPKKNELYWKRDDNTMLSKDTDVDSDYRDRYNVTLTDHSIYTLRWVVKPDDVGKYHCMCDSNQFLFQLRPIIPCNKPSFLADSSKVVKDFTRTKKPLQLASNQSITFDLNLDCGCTYPGPNRTFKGTWMVKYLNGTMTRYQGFQDIVVGLDPGETPTGCYTEPGPIVYRYNNVKANFQKVTFSCNHDVDLDYFFFVDEDQKGAEPMIGIHCTAVSANSCSPRVAAGASSNPEYVVGYIAKLKCDVSSYDSKNNALYWKRDKEIISQDLNVTATYRDRYNVTLKDDIYMLQWIVKQEDLGKYSCKCDSNQLQFKLWPIIPCNKPSFLVDSSQVVKDYTRTKKPLQLASNQSVTFDLNLDCGCTYPGPGRTLKGTWMVKDPNGTMTRYQKFQDTVVRLDPGETPTGCYTEPGSNAVYRFYNVKANFQKVTFSCNHGVDLDFFFLVDEDQKGAEPMIGVHCTETVLSVAAIIGICIGIAAVGISIGIIVYCRRGGQRGSSDENDASSSNKSLDVASPAADSEGNVYSITNIVLAYFHPNSKEGGTTTSGQLPGASRPRIENLD